MKLRITTLPLRKKMLAKEEERLNKTYWEILKDMGIEPADEIKTECFDITKFTRECKLLKGYKVCIKHGKSLRYFITVYFKKGDKIHDVLTLFFDSNGRHEETAYLHTLGSVHKLEKKEEVKNYERTTARIFSKLLGVEVEMQID